MALLNLADISVAGAFSQSFGLIVSFDPDLIAIVALTLKVSLTAVVVASLVALPLAALLALRRIPGYRVWVMILNTLMSLPPVIVGLFVFALLSTDGVLGALNWLYTPAAMMLAQCLLVTPIIAAVAHELLSQRLQKLEGLFLTFNRGGWFDIFTLLFDSRLFLLTAVVAGLGRALAEVGAVMIVGGNILGQTRVLTTAIVLESSMGRFETAMALGIILLALALLINLILSSFRKRLVMLTPT